MCHGLARSTQWQRHATCGSGGLAGPTWRLEAPSLRGARRPQGASLQEIQKGARKLQEVLERPRKRLEALGGPSRALAGPRETQRAPGGPRKTQEAPGRPCSVVLSRQNARATFSHVLRIYVLSRQTARATFAQIQKYAFCRGRMPGSLFHILKSMRSVEAECPGHFFTY